MVKFVEVVCDCYLITVFQDGLIRKIYATSGDRFGVLTSTPDGTKISTMFHKAGCDKDFLGRLAAYYKDATGPPPTVSDAARSLARFLGFRAFQVYINVNGQSSSVDKCNNMDPTVHEHIAHLLTALAN